jgi:gamma-glutamyltranspeptidase
MIEPNLPKWGHNSVKAIQVITEASLRWQKCIPSDPDFVKIPVKELLDSFISKTEWVISFDKPQNHPDIGKGKLQVTKSKPHTILLLMLKEMQFLQPLP